MIPSTRVTIEITIWTIMGRLRLDMGDWSGVIQHFMEGNIQKFVLFEGKSIFYIIPLGHQLRKDDGRPGIQYVGPNRYFKGKWRKWLHYYGK